MDDAEGADVVYGPPETWEEFADKCQRMLGQGSRAFICKQVGAGHNAPAFVITITPGPFREDLMMSVAKALMQEQFAKGEGE